MEAEYNELLNTMREAVQVYGKVLKLARGIAEGLEQDKDVNEVISLADEREALLTTAGELDAKISGTMAEPGRETWMERKEAAGLRGELMAVIEEVMKTDAASVKMMEGLFAGIKDNFGSMATGRKSAAAYGGKEKKNQPKIVDRAY